MEGYVSRWSLRRMLVCAVVALIAAALPVVARAQTVTGTVQGTVMPWQGHSMAVRIEGFNVFNWVQFGFPDTNITSPTFGRINGTATQYAPRTVQLVLRYRY